MSDRPRGFDALMAKHQWPEAPAYPDVEPVGRSDAGIELLLDHISERDQQTVVLEIGAEFGGSTRRFLSNPSTWVISVDPWPDTYATKAFEDTLQKYYGKPGAIHGLFQTFCWEHRDRLIAVRDMCPSGPLAVRDAGVAVDLVYIDGDHRYDAVLRDLFVSSALFPDAVICGDDWRLESNQRKYEGMLTPVRHAVMSWAKFQDVAVETRENTWMIDPSHSYNLEIPPPRYVTLAGALGGLQEQVDRIERYVTHQPVRSRLRRVRDRLLRDVG